MEMRKCLIIKLAKTGRYTNFAPYGLGIISKHLASIGYDVNFKSKSRNLQKKSKNWMKKILIMKKY